MKLLILPFSALILWSQTSCSSVTAANTGTAADTAARNKGVIMACVAGLNAHDPARVMKDYAPNFVEYGDGSEADPDKDHLRAGMTRIFHTYPDLKSENAAYYAQGNEVIVVSDFTLSFINDMADMKATGKTAKFRDVDIFTLNKNGQVTSHRSIYPASAMYAQLGISWTGRECTDQPQ